MDKIIMGDSGPLAAQKSFSEYSVSSTAGPGKDDPELTESRPA